MPEDYVQIVKMVEDYGYVKLWAAIRHCNGITTEGYAQWGPDDGDTVCFSVSNPNERPSFLDEMIQLPAVWPTTMTMEEIKTNNPEIIEEWLKERWEMFERWYASHKEGKTYKQIALEAGVSPSTIAKHVKRYEKNLYRKPVY
jgi:hypothetical protein